MAFSTKFALWMTAAGVAIGLLPGKPAHAADVKVLSFLSSRPILEEVAPSFTKATGHRLVIVYGSIEPQRDLIAKGEVADVLITSRAVAGEIAGRIAPNGVTDLARITIRLFVRAGAPKADISTVAGLRDTLLKAESVAFTNPARGALAGRNFANALNRMGIYDQILARAKIIPGLGHDVVAAVVRGEATIGAGPTNDVTPKPDGIDILGGLPRELDSDTPIVAAIPASATSPEAAAAFVKFMQSPVGVAALTRQGLEP